MPALPTTARLAAAALACAALFAAPAQAQSFSSLVVFGDSISDSGNIALATRSPSGDFNYTGLPDSNLFIPSLAYPPLGTYPLGVLSNGAPWTVQFAARLGMSAAPSLLGGPNFAFGGARIGGLDANGQPLPDVPVPTVSTQVGMFLGATGHVAPPSALYIVASGANNARDALETVLPDGSNLLSVAGAAGAAYAGAVDSIVHTLRAAGASNFLVFNTPNIGVTPAVRALGVSGAASFVAGTMNAALAAAMADETGVRIFDSFDFLTRAAADPASVGLLDSSGACGFAGNGIDCATAVFWDGIHPTTALHGAIAGAVYAQLVPEPATYGLMALGLGVVGLLARRRQGAATAA